MTTTSWVPHSASFTDAFGRRPPPADHVFVIESVS
jgi:hypothetical protein